MSDPQVQASEIATTLDAVDRALDRLREGTYRTCARCGDSISDDILAGEPLRATCVAHPTLAG